MSSPPSSASENSQPKPGVSQEAVAGAPWLVFSKLFLFFVYFGISVLMVRSLGKEAYGVYSICRNLVEYGLVFAALGLNAALIRFIPELVVNQNKAGMVRLIGKSAILQLAGCGLVTLLLLLLQQQLEGWFNTDLGNLLPLCGLLLLALVAKDFTNDSLTSLFRSREVAFFSILQGTLWLGFVGWAAWSEAGIGSMLGAQAGATLIASGMATWFLVHYLRRLNWRSPTQGIGRSRAMKLALATWGNHLARALMLKYTEVFFVGAFVGTAAAGIYDLGYTIPFLVITFIPMAVQTLMAASVYEAYTRHPEQLPQLISSIYKFLILLAVPLAAFGLFFAPRGIVLIYGEEMRDAGPVAAAFCVLHVLPLISIPLSMAIQAKEKLHNMLPLMLLQVAVNILLDILLIPRFGIPGAISAVFLTFALTIPLRLWMVKRLVGGIYFPFFSLVRIVIPCTLLAGLLYRWLPQPDLPVLIALSLLYLILVAAGVRFGLLVAESDKSRFRSLITGKARKIFLILLGPEKTGEPQK